MKNIIFFITVIVVGCSSHESNVEINKINQPSPCMIADLRGGLFYTNIPPDGIDSVILLRQPYAGAQSKKRLGINQYNLNTLDSLWELSSLDLDSFDYSTPAEFLLYSNGTVNYQFKLEEFRTSPFATPTADDHNACQCKISSYKVNGVSYYAKSIYLISPDKASKLGMTDSTNQIYNSGMINTKEK